MGFMVELVRRGHLAFPNPLPSTDLHALMATTAGSKVSDASVIVGEVVKASEICTVQRECMGMVVVFLLPFCRIEVSGLSGYAADLSFCCLQSAIIINSNVPKSL
jgi:hypothetical protein